MELQDVLKKITKIIRIKAFLEMMTISTLAFYTHL